MGICAYVCNDLDILAQRWILDPYWYLCIVPNKHALRTILRNSLLRKENSQCRILMRAGEGGSFKCSEVLFLRPGRAIVTFVSPLSQLECIPFHRLFSHLIVIGFFFFFFFFFLRHHKTSLIDSWKC